MVVSEVVCILEAVHAQFLHAAVGSARFNRPCTSTKVASTAQAFDKSKWNWSQEYRTPALAGGVLPGLPRLVVPGLRAPCAARD